MVENRQTFRQAVMEFARVAYIEPIMYPLLDILLEIDFPTLKRKRKHRDTGQVADPGEYFYTADEIAMMEIAEALITLGASCGVSVDEFVSAFRETDCWNGEIIEG